MTIRDDLDSRIVAVLDAQVLGNFDTTEAEFAQTFLLDGRDQDGVEVAPGVIAEGDEDLDGGARMSHCQLDGTAVEGPCGTGGANGGAAAGEGALVFFIGFALRGEFQSEVGGDEGGQQGKGQEDELHDDSDFDGM